MEPWPASSVSAFRRGVLRRPRWVVAFVLLFLYAGGVWVRTASFYSRGHQHSDPFWVESAQHFRNVRMVAEGRGIPRQDIDLEYPDGLETRSHTILGEYAIGLLARLLPLEGISRLAHRRALFGLYLDQWLDPFWPVRTPTLSAFVRYFVRLSMCSLIFWIYLITYEVTRNRVAGILAALLYAFSFGAISRSLGDTFYHEHVALPLLGVHLWFFFRALRRESVWNAVLCALFLVAALLTWKVIEFYFLVLVLYFFLMFLRVGLERREMRLLGLITLGVLLTSILFDVHLRYSRFFLSRGMLAAYALLFSQALVWKKGQRWKWLAVPVALLLLALKAGLLPDAGRYGHVWQTFFYRLWYWHKPLDPTRLPFDVRHYWVPPYVSPNLFAFLNEVFWPVALALPAAAAFAGYLLLPGAWKPRPMPPERRQQAFLLVGFVAFLVFYLLFYKIKTFLLLFSIPWVGLVWVRWKGLALRPGAAVSVTLCLLALVALLAYAWGAVPAAVVAVVVLIVWGRVSFVGLRIPQRVALGLLVFFAVLAQGYHTVAWNRSELARALFALGIRQSSEKEASVVVSGGTIPGVLDWIERESEPGEAFLAEFVLSPSILTYANRPINQHCFFESDMRLKYEEFAHALFKSEEEFYAFCRKYETTYFVYNAHMLLRDDPNMSFRYITANRGWNTDWAAYRFHFRPETLEHFRLVYQNDFMRVYRVLPPGEAPGGSNRNRPYSPLFDEEVFQKVARLDAAGVPDAASFLYPAVKAFDLYERARVYLASSRPEAQALGLAEMARAVEQCPWATPISTHLGEVYLALGQEEAARRWFEHSLRWRPDDPAARAGLNRL